MSNDTTNRYISQVVLPPKEEGDTERLYLIKDQKAQDNIELLQSNLTSLDTELDMLDTKIDNIDIPNISNLVSTDDLTNTVSGLISKKETNDNYVTWSSLLTYYSNNTTLNNNYAHITDGIIDNAEISYEDINGLYENYAHVDNNYIIDNATINHENVNGLYENYAHVNNGIINNATISYTNINDLDGNYAHVTDGVIDNATISYININDLDGNYARVINGIIIDANIDYTRINNLNDNYAHITGGLIDNASIRYTNIEDLDDNYAHVTDGIIDNANIDYAHINNLDANYAHITNGVIDNAYIDQAKVNNLDANYAHIQNGVIDNANIDQANINNLNANYAHITNGTIDNANISYANVSNLNAHYAHLEDGVIDNALIGYANVDQLDSHYAEIDMANVNNAWIENGVIKDAAITDAKIFGVSANKLTAGRIDASNINVINLRADNLIVTKINGQPVIGGYTLVSPEISGYIDKNPSQENWYEFYNNLYTLTVDTFVDPNKNYYTTSDSVELYDQTTIDSMFEDVNARIDSQIETWTVDELPTLMNYPAENWTTNDLKDAHIGDICYVVNASNDYNGYTYRFAYDNTSHQYSWILIQDNQVTAALGRITQLETFNNQLVHWEDATDEGVITVRGRFTELSGRIDKTVKSSIQLWYTKANTTAPNAPTSQVTSTNTNGGAWTTVVPIYDENYPNYFYCWQYQYEDDTYGWSAVIYDQATTETQEAARTVPPDLLDYISDNIETIQEQVLDGQLEIWYGSTNPALNNAPTNDWPSSKYEDHIGDLYYNTTNGSVWQWTENNSVYSWSEIPDSAASTALAAAQSAQATADGKRKIFTTTPTVPYDIGDLWVTGSTVKYANVAKTSSQTYNENDWSLTATDDTTANANIKSSIQLWYTSNSTTPPNKPYTDGSSNHVTSTSTSGNTWTTVVPIYNSSTSKYHYCYQQQRGDGTYQWTTPVYDDATTTAMAKAQSALPVSTFETFEQTTFKEVTDTIDTQQSTITQLQTKTERALSQGVEYIVGTHGTTATNVWTGVTQDEQLYTGKQIAFYMTSAGVSGSAVTLNLQLSDETWSGPINVKINDTNVTDQYPINTVLRLTYDGGSWKSDNYNSDTNYYDREAYKANVTANGAISAGRIGVFGTDGKLKLLSNSAFDTSYPILYIGTAYTTNALTQTNNYTFWGTPFNLTNTHSIVGAAAGKPVYIVGTLNGNVITPTTNVLTCTIPTEADNLFYIRLGLMSSTTNAVLESQHPIYAFIDGAFQQTTKSVITISNTVNTVRQTADTNSAKISNLTQTLGTNADGTTAADDIVHQISEIDQNLDGISTRVSKTEVSLRGTFATSSTAANTAAKTATIFPENNDFELYTGATITVKFTNNNTASAPTLNINSTGAKPIKTYSGANLSEAEYQWDAGSTMNFVYDGTNWCIQDSTELTRLKNNESRITQTANSITSLVANNETYTAPDGTTKTNTIRSAIKQNADNIDLRVEKANVIASINASVETDGTSAVKISADKVNVEGATIFNSGRLSTTNLNNAYDSKGSASAAQTAAISAAAADATSKANAARDAAISAANQNTTQQINTVNNQEQLIYIQAVSGTLSIPDNQKPNAWVTNTGESVSSDEEGLTPVWTTKHPTYRSKYPVLFVAIQRQTVGGTVTCTTPLKDDTTTVIDGGHITTGTIDATDVNVTNINASEITTGTLAANRIESRSLTIDKFTDESQADILNSHIGQPNLIPFFSFDLMDIYHSTNNPNGYWYANSATPTGPNATWNNCWTQLENGWVHIEESNSSSSTIRYYASGNVAADTFIESGKTYTILTEMRNCIGTPDGIYASTGAGDTRLPSSANQVSNYSSGSYTHYDVRTAKDATGTTPSRPFNFRIDLAAGNSFSCDVRVSLYEGEYGGPYKPYVDQTLSNRVKTAETAIEQNAEAITLRATKTETLQMAQPNLTPYFSADPTDVYNSTTNPHGYWHVAMDAASGNWTQLEDGWARLSKDNSSSTGSAYGNVRTEQISTLKPNTGYTLMVEARNVTVSGTVSLKGIAVRSGVGQFSATQTNTLTTTTSAVFYQYGTTLSDFTNLKESTSGYIQINAGASITGDFRFSLYEGEYSGPYKPYVGPQLYASQAELKVANDAISMRVEKNGIISSINQSEETVQIDASKVEINGTAIFNAIESNIENEINLTRTWYAECPTAAATAAKIATITPTTTAFTLDVGTTVSVKFTYANTVANPTLNVNGTGAIAIMRYGTTAPSTSAATSWQANSINTLTYDGTYWRLNNWLNDNTTYNLGRNLHATAIKVLEDIANGLLMAGTANGYIKIAAGISFSLSYPLLYASAAYTANTTYTNTYETWNSVTYSSTAAIQSGAANKTIYLKGKVSANTFTIDSTNVFTTVEPTSEDGCFYIPLGIMSSSTIGNFATSNSLYAYLDGRFRQVTPTEIVASQRIYYRSRNPGTVPKPTAWIALATNKYNDTVSVGNDGWRTKVTPIAESKAENVTKYLYLYTCEQRKRLDGTIECTDVTLDENTTIIDGGNIITHTVTAEQLNATSINASRSLTVGAMTEAAASTILNSNIEIGGRNLLYSTADWSRWAKTEKATVDNEVLTTTNTDTSSGFQRANGWFIPDKTDVMDREIVVSFDVKKTDSTALSSLVFQMFTTSAPPISVDSGNINEGTRYYTNLAAASTDKVTILNTSEINSATWTRVSIGFIPSQVFNTSYTEQTYLAVYVGINNTVASAQFRHIKAEYGNKATDWTSAFEDVNLAIEQSVAGQGGFTILWNYENFTTANNGEGYICALDPITGTKSDSDGWIMWNGVKRTIPKGMINPNTVHPYNTPCYVVCRLSSADATAGTNYIVSYNSGWKGGVINSGALSDWTWNEATDIIIGKYVETASEAAFVEMEIYNPPLSSKQITTQNITASRANDTATTANNKLVAFRGVCSTTASTAAKVVSCTGFALTQGYSITVYNTTDNTSAAKLTLNVNSLGAKDVWVAGAVTADTNRLLWKAGSTITFVYDGTRFRVADSPASLYGTTCAIAEETAAKTTTVNDCVIFKGTQITVPMSNSNTATSPTLNVSSLGATNIYYGSSTTGPTKANGYAWPATAAVIFTYDGKFWRFGNQTFIDGGNILTGQIAADRINVSQIQIGNLSGASNYSTTSQMNAAISESIDQTYVQNLTPYFQRDMSKQSDEYWTSLTISRTVNNEDISVFTKLDDGWAHFECTNTGTSTINNYIRQKTIDTLTPGDSYTLLVEFRNVSISADGGSFYSQQGDYYQIWGTGSTGGFSITNAEIRALQNGSGVFYKTLTLLDVDSKDPSGTVRGKLPKAHFMSINQQVQAGQTISYDVRISLYENGYTGPYKPYVGPQLYASGTDVSDLNTSLADTNSSIQNMNESLDGISDAVDELKEDQVNRGRWLTFNEEDALTIGKVDSEFKVVMNEERQAFMYGDDMLAYTSGDRFVAPRMEADEMHIGNWMWVKRNNGNLSLKWIG